MNGGDRRVPRGFRRDHVLPVGGPTKKLEKKKGTCVMLKIFISCDENN